ncbi:hypothetical protein [Prochlorococcus sp. MIT 1306]|uniref:hypothetical protein n=1 Tax=Prochlorococcus sp. MIT 1306 TaxID=1799667 RepID=UPI0007BC6748|nr:hypothetical protein [Prochlorococcus sp. MIT 1306]KZR62904.1 hypothetical protein PMIT1306_01386 [Prochlorococcus sp. MIT 1306]
MPKTLKTPFKAGCLHVQFLSSSPQINALEEENFTDMHEYIFAWCFFLNTLTYTKVNIYGGVNDSLQRLTPTSKHKLA